MHDQWGWDKKIAELRKAKVDLPKILAEAGEKYYAKNFDKQQWNGSAWLPRIKETKRSAGKAILVNTSNLRNKMQKTIQEYNYKKIVWAVNVSYAKYLNFGTPKMVARKFMGGDKEFLHKMKARITFQFNKVMHAK